MIVLLCYVARICGKEYLSVDENSLRHTFAVACGCFKLQLV
jgi:hypothetical protein